METPRPNHLLATYRPLPLTVVRGRGTSVWDDRNRQYLDFYGGHCVTILGHAHPSVAVAIAEQAGKILFYSNAVHYAPRDRVASKIARLCPDGLESVFFCNSGTEANEAALKIARKHTGRTEIVAMDGGFHGRTLGSLACTSGRGYRDPYEYLLGNVSFATFGDSQSLANRLRVGNVAAVILEPIQSMAGVRTAEPSYYRTLRELCDESGSLLIFDEIQTGVGRTGTFSYAEYVNVSPDILTMAKSLGNGVPVGATVVTERLAKSVNIGDQGTTFGGGPLAVAATEATLDTILADQLMGRAAAIFDQISASVEAYVVDCRGRGCLIGLELDVPSTKVRDGLLEKGIIVGTSNDPSVIRLFPPLNTSSEEIDVFTAAFADVVEELRTIQTA